jgi:hypothetical protein
MTPLAGMLRLIVAGLKDPWRRRRLPGLPGEVLVLKRVRHLISLIFSVIAFEHAHK